MNLKLSFTLLLVALLIAACGSPPASVEPTPDVAFVRTSAASTVISQFTLTAAAFTPTSAVPTNTSAPEITNTAAPASPTPPLQGTALVTGTPGTVVALCDSLSYDVATVDVNVPDNTVMSPGQDFIKTWRVKNNGSCEWGAGYVLAYAGYTDQMSGQFVALTDVVLPGEEVEVSVQFKAPAQAGTYLSAWQMRNPAGVTFEEIIFAKIIVQ